MRLIWPPALMCPPPWRLCAVDGILLVDYNYEVRSSKVLPSVISADMTLTRDNLYIIPSGTVITKGTTVNVEPGTHIQFWTADPDEPYADTYMASLRVNGTLNINGTKEDPVYIYPSDLMSEYAVQMYARNDGELNMTWTDVTNLIMYYNEGGSYSIGDGYITTADHCTFRMNYGDGHIRYRNLSDGTVHDQMSNSGMMTHFRLATNCVFYKMALTYGLDVRGTLDGCIFADSALNFTENRDVLGHDYGWVTVTEPGCVSSGLRRGSCIRCGHGTEEVLEPLGHEYTSQITPPGCTEGGFTTHTCTRCGDSYTDSFTEPTGHRHEWFRMADPTCDADGWEQGTAPAAAIPRPALSPPWGTTGAARPAAAAA